MTSATITKPAPGTVDTQVEAADAAPTTRRGKVWAWCKKHWKLLAVIAL